MQTASKLVILDVSYRYTQGMVLDMKYFGTKKRQVRDSNPCMLAHNRYLVFDLEAVAVPLG